MLGFQSSWDNLPSTASMADAQSSFSGLRTNRRLTVLRRYSRAKAIAANESNGNRKPASVAPTERIFRRRRPTDRVSACQSPCYAAECHLVFGSKPALDSTVRRHQHHYRVMNAQQMKPTRPCLSGTASAVTAQMLIRWIGISIAVGLAIIGVSIAVCTAIGAVIGVTMNDMAAIPWVKPDIVSINTLPDTHASFAMQAMEAGAHVFVEKPLALTVAEAEQTVATARRTSRSSSSATSCACTRPGLASSIARQLGTPTRIPHEPQSAVA